jgi:hypothetical protein
MGLEGKQGYCRQRCRGVFCFDGKSKLTTHYEFKENVYSLLKLNYLLLSGGAGWSACFWTHP